MDEVVGGLRCGFQLEQDGEHLLAERVFDQRRLVGPVRSEGLAEPISLGLDAPLATGSLESGLELCAGESGGWEGVAAGLVTACRRLGERWIAHVRWGEDRQVAWVVMDGTTVQPIPAGDPPPAPAGPGRGTTWRAPGKRGPMMLAAVQDQTAFHDEAVVDRVDGARKIKCLTSTALEVLRSPHDLHGVWTSNPKYQEGGTMAP
ncbi:hypothetical protein [Kitasatospora sp. A2-31]|uniref:hypothetical protein n=1 Tax=Kitasatospora sp. A2-31 TaxID=2916414 RepID=UPI001EEE5B2F|nr:hypothetical protein [Kitasatospora sp. A2-31]MCG6499800.1 hypothetical protein [Kitasatospora sp. A2-31]